jgi:hypothetical protein
VRKKPKHKPVVMAEGVFLDLNNCGSSVHYNIDLDDTNMLSGSVVLRDCHRTITWGAYETAKSPTLPDGRDTMTVKLDKAIEILTEARQKWGTLRRLQRQRAKK